MNIGDIIRIEKSSHKTQYTGIIINYGWDNKLSHEGPVKMYTILWSNGMIGGLSEYFCTHSVGLEVISESR